MNKSTHPSGLLSVRETAEILGISVSTIREKLLGSALPTVRLSERAIRIPRAAVEALIVEKTIS